LAFRQIANHFKHPDNGELHDLGDGTQETLEGNIQHCIARWGDAPALEIRALEVESWLKSIAKDNGGKYEWSTVGKIRDAMSVVYSTLNATKSFLLVRSTILRVLENLVVPRLKRNRATQQCG
jgi:hypothetical protein